MVSKVNLVLFDLKHTDPEIHKKYTGVDNSQILKNLEYLCMSDTDFYIRIPLIPGVNDSLENMENAAQLIKDAKYLKRVELLPYHQTAGAKYEMVGRTFNPRFDQNVKVKIWQDVFKDQNINVSVL